MRALPRLSPRPTAAAQPCRMPAAPLAPVRADAGRAVLIGACMAALGRTHHGGLRIESKSGQLRRYLSALHCTGGTRSREAVVRGQVLVRMWQGLRGAHVYEARRSTARWPHPAPRYHPAEEPARQRSFDAIRSASHRSDGSRGSTQAGKLLTCGRQETAPQRAQRRCLGGGVHWGRARAPHRLNRPERARRSEPKRARGLAALWVADR
jgi:hypothetical protein